MKKKLLKHLAMLSKFAIYGLLAQLVAYSTLLATDTHAQQYTSVKKIYLDLGTQERSIIETFRYIESKTDLRINYEEKDIDKSLKISSYQGTSSLEEILLNISKVANLRFRQINENINVLKEKSRKSEAAVEVIIDGVTVTGKVQSAEDEEGIPGVNVVVKGTSQGTVTDLDGNYTLEVPSAESVLSFSSVGFISEEVAVGNRTVINLMLTPDITALDEIVVIGYGTRAKRDVTTSISSISSEEIANSVSMTPEMAMQGRMTGVYVSDNNGDPMNRPQIRIRGVNTWGVAEPLYVVDGIPITELGAGVEGQEDARVRDVRGPLNIMTMIDPNDIESISVLKDASAAAIYGVRAANGVVLITTKKGRGDKPSVDFSARYGVQNITQELDVLNTEQYTAHINQVYASDPTVSRPVENDGLFNPSSPTYLGNSDTYNWQRALRNENAPMQDYSMRVSGGTEKSDYYLSLGFAETEGTLIGNYLKRYSGAFKLNSQVTDWLKIGGQYRVAYAEGSDGNGINYWEYAQTPPWQPIYDERGPKGFAPAVVGYDSGVYKSSKLYGVGTRINKLGQLAHREIEYESLRNMGNAYIQLEPLAGLTIKGSLSLDTYTTTRYQFQDLDGNVFDYTRGDPAGVADGNSVGTYEERDTYNNNIVGEITLNYLRSVGDHNFDLLLNVMQQKYDAKYRGANTEYMTTKLDYLRKLGGENIYTTVASDLQRWALAGQLARLGYNYRSTYYLDVTVRRDGSSRFAPENRWGVFPSMSAAYRITNEPFMQGISWLNDLKLRAGWGKLGNQEVINLAYLSPIDVRPSYAWGNRDNNGLGYYSTGAAVYSIPNRDLVWEKTETTNLGFDATVLNGLNVSFEYYHKMTDGLLQSVSLPKSVGVIDQPRANVGSVKNSGIEIALNYAGSIGDLTYSIGGNLTTVHNEVVSMYNDVPQFGLTSNIEEGYPLFYIRTQKVGGIFQTQDEVDEYLKRIRDTGYQNSKIRPGDFYYQDLRSAPTEEGEFYSTEADTTINNFDAVMVGQTIPGYFYGLNLSLGYKGFDFSVQFVGVGDVQKYNHMRAAMEYTPGMGNNLTTNILDESWSEDNRDGTLPRVIAGDPASNFRQSDRFVEDAGYLRLNNLQIGYTVPTIEAIGLKNLRVYTGASNLFTITPYSGLDPEDDNYPMPRTFFLGLNMRF